MAATGTDTLYAERLGISGTLTVDDIKNYILPAIIQSYLEQINIHDNGSLVVFAGDTRVDTGWARGGNIFKYNGSPDYVEGIIAVNAFDDGASNNWTRPKLKVLKNDEIIYVIDDLVMQDTRAYDGDATIAGTFVDAIPGKNPVYTFEWFDDENRISTLVPEKFSNITLKAVG